MACLPAPLRSATPQTKTCLWGPRYGQSLRDAYTTFGMGLPLVGTEILQTTSLHLKGSTHVT